jgi:hypothetical protein
VHKGLEAMGPTEHLNRRGEPTSKTKAEARREIAHQILFFAFFGQLLLFSESSKAGTVKRNCFSTKRRQIHEVGLYELRIFLGAAYLADKPNQLSLKDSKKFAEPNQL